MPIRSGRQHVDAKRRRHQESSTRQMEVVETVECAISVLCSRILSDSVHVVNLSCCVGSCRIRFFSFVLGMFFFCACSCIGINDVVLVVVVIVVVVIVVLLVLLVVRAVFLNLLPQRAETTISRASTTLKEPLRSSVHCQSTISTLTTSPKTAQIRSLPLSASFPFPSRATSNHYHHHHHSCL